MLFFVNCRINCLKRVTVALAVPLFVFQLSYFQLKAMQEQKQQAMITCPICMDEQSSQSYFKCKKCFQHICKSCLKKTFVNQIDVKEDLFQLDDNTQLKQKELFSLDYDKCPLCKKNLNISIINGFNNDSFVQVEVLKNEVGALRNKWEKEINDGSLPLEVMNKIIELDDLISNMRQVEQNKGQEINIDEPINYSLYEELQKQQQKMSQSALLEMAYQENKKYLPKKTVKQFLKDLFCSCCKRKKHKKNQ
jgi:hypothetical protein